MDGIEKAGPPGASADSVLRLSRLALWCLPVWALLLGLSTLTHQPDYEVEFDAYARYITTDRFLLSHIFASTVGAGIGTIGLVALFILLTTARLIPLSSCARGSRPGQHSRDFCLRCGRLRAARDRGHIPAGPNR
jgi:hypothetical protein